MESNGERSNGAVADSPEDREAPQIDLQELADRVLRLLKKEARIEQERQGQPAHLKRVSSARKRI